MDALGADLAGAETRNTDLSAPAQPFLADLGGLAPPTAPLDVVRKGRYRSPSHIWNCWLWAEYLAAVERIGCGSGDPGHLANPDERLAEHLMAFYWRGRLDLDDPVGLLHRFYETADDALRAHALSFVGRSLYNTPGQLSRGVAERLTTLWAHRLCAALTNDSSSCLGEVAAFGWWFASGRFGDAWSMSQLEQVLAVTREVEADRLVVERLSALATAFPLESVGCLGSLIESAPTWHLHAWHDHARAVLVAALRSGSESARQVAAELINRLGARGYMQFRTLLAGLS